MEKKKTVEWLNLPNELWVLISTHLTATIDILRFRSTCHSWRSVLPLPSPPFPSLFPPPQIHIPLPKFSILQTKIYHLQPKSSSQSQSKGWIIKIGESESLPLPLLDLFTNSSISRTLLRFPPKVLNLNNFRITEFIEAYTLDLRSIFSDEEEDEDEEEFERVYPAAYNVRKVVLFSNFQSNRIVFFLQQDRKLGFFKIGDTDNKDWTFMDYGNMFYDDIILHKGQLYTVDKLGTIFWINCSSLKLVQFSPMLYGLGNKKELVEYGGSLYVVDMYIEEDHGKTKGMYCRVFDIKVYKLDEEWGRWLDVKDLGDAVFVLGKDTNFSLSAQDYYGWERNCLYFHSEDRVWCFGLKDSRFKSSTLFWPCPNLFHPIFNL